MNLKSTPLILTTVSALALGVGGYMYINAHNAHASEEQPASAPQAIPVAAQKVNTQPISIWKEFSGRLRAVDSVAIRPQVSGTLQEIKFTDGQMVKKGDALMIINPREFEANVLQAQAELTAAENEVRLAEKDYKRAQGLIKTKAISQKIYDERYSASLIAKANEKAASAKLERAKIDLDYANITAPISGRISRAEITEGNLVEAGPNAPVLTTIVSNDKIYADFDVDEQTYLKYIRGQAKNISSENKIPVRLILQSDQSEYNGFIHSFDNRIDTASGTIRARALFSNKDSALLPGMYAIIKMGSPVALEGLLVPERAIGTNQDRKFIYTVENNTVAYRPIEIGESIEGMRIVNSGLKDGDVIITDGIIRLRPGMNVSPQFSEEEKSAQMQ